MLIKIFATLLIVVCIAATLMFFGLAVKGLVVTAPLWEKITLTALSTVTAALCCTMVKLMIGSFRYATTGVWRKGPDVATILAAQALQAADPGDPEYLTTAEIEEQLISVGKRMRK